METRTGYLQLLLFDSHSSLNLSPKHRLCSDHKHVWTVYTGDDVQISFASTLGSHVVLQFVVLSLEGDAFSENLFKICTGVYMYVSVYIYVWGPAGDS